KPLFLFPPLFFLSPPRFRFELDYNPTQRRVADILRGVNNRGIESSAIRHDIDKYLGLSIGPLLEPCPVELHHHALAMAVSRACVTDRESLFEYKEPSAIVADCVLFGRDDFRRRLDRRMIWLDVYFKEGASGRPRVRLAGFEDRYVASGQLAACLSRAKLNLTKRDYDAVAATRQPG